MADNNPTESLTILIFCPDSGASIITNKLVMDNHNPIDKGAGTMTEVFEDIEKYPGAEMIFMDPGSSLPNSYMDVAAVQQKVPHLPIVLVTWDPNYWTIFCERERKLHQVVSYEQPSYQTAIAAAQQASARI